MKKIALLSNEQLVEAYQQSSNQDYLVELFDTQSLPSILYY